MPSVSATSENSAGLRRCRDITHEGAQQAFGNGFQIGSLFGNEAPERNDGRRWKDNAVARQFMLEVTNQGGGGHHDTQAVAPDCQSLAKFPQHARGFAGARRAAN